MQQSTIIGSIEYYSLFKVLASPADTNAIDTDGDGIPDASDTSSSGVSQDPNQSNPNYQSQRFTCDPNSETLQYGSKGNKVVELQTYLIDLGFGPELEPEKIDGKFGPHTKNAVVAYQKDFSLSVDGKVGPETWSSLCEQVSLLHQPQIPSISIDYDIPGYIDGIIQPSENTCWATVATMMKEWKDQRSYSIEGVMSIVGPEYLQKFKDDKTLLGSEVPMFLGASGLVAENPASYNIDGYLNLLKSYGPLWVTISPNPGDPFSAHAVILTGISGDGTPSGTMFKLMDPLDGKLHTPSFDQYLQQYEALALTPGSPLIFQIQHYPIQYQLNPN